MHPRRVGFGSTAAWARTGPRPIRLSSHFLPNALRVRQTTRSNRLPRRASFTRKTRLSILLSSRKTERCSRHELRSTPENRQRPSINQRFFLRPQYYPLARFLSPL